MSGQDDPYSRLYWRVKGDKRFEHVYGCDPCWAAYTRLLIDAEASYPAPASLPRTLKPHARTQLAEAGIIELQPHDCFIVHGLKAERDRRSEAARGSAEGRWAPQYGSIAPSNAPALPPQYERNATAMLTEPRRDEPNLAEPSQAPETGPDVWYWVTLRYPDKRVNANLWDWLSRLCDDFGVVRLWEVMRTCYAQDRNKGTLLTRTEAVLSRETDQAERASERERLAEKRKPIVIQPKPEETPEERERREAAFAKMRESVKTIGIA